MNSAGDTGNTLSSYMSEIAVATFLYAHFLKMPATVPSTEQQLRPKWRLVSFKGAMRLKPYIDIIMKQQMSVLEGTLVN